MRKRKRNLGSLPEDHFSKGRLGFTEYKERVKMAVELANKGSCVAAISEAQCAVYKFGQSVAHYQSIGTKAAPGSQADYIKDLQEVITKCVKK